jgi:hypothetical protein
MIFLPKELSYELNYEGIYKPRLRKTLQNRWPVIFKNVEDRKDKVDCRTVPEWGRLKMCT